MIHGLGSKRDWFSQAAFLREKAVHAAVRPDIESEGEGEH